MKKENTVVAEHLELQWWYSAAVAFYVKCDTQLHRGIYFKILYLQNTVSRLAFPFLPMHSVQNNIKHTKSHSYCITKVSLQSRKSHPFSDSLRAVYLNLWITEKFSHWILHIWSWIQYWLIIGMKWIKYMGNIIYIIINVFCWSLGHCLFNSALFQFSFPVAE